MKSNEQDTNMILPSMEDMTNEIGQLKAQLTLSENALGNLRAELSDVTWYKNEYRKKLDAYENQSVEEIANELIIKLEATQQTAIQSVTIRRNRQYKTFMMVSYKPSRKFYDLEQNQA